jgi:hypothetical protein
MSTDREEFVGHLARTIGRHPEWRYGQAVWNTALALYPDQVEPFRGSRIDPFYRDELAEAFLDAIFGGAA